MIVPTSIVLNIDIVTWCRTEIYTFQSQQRQLMHDMEENDITCTHTRTTINIIIILSPTAELAK